MGRAAALTAHLAPPHRPEVDGAGGFLAKTGMATARLRSPAGGKRDADRTRERILQAARGYAGARIDAICRPARANPATALEPLAAFLRP